jgi:hypothetical protein
MVCAVRRVRITYSLFLSLFLVYYILNNGVVLF